MAPLATDNVSLSRPKARLRVEILDELMRAKGASSYAEQARRFGIDPAFYHHLRTGKKSASVTTALNIAAAANTTVETLWARAA
jgi:DNA-binding XRE family transcriptional regulator